MEETGLITLEYVNTVIKGRPREIHKGQCGRILIVAGSRGMAGAAALTALGALKSGAGLVYLSIPSELYHILQILVPQAMCLCTHEELPSRPLEMFDSIAIGPGLGVDENRYDLIEAILNKYDGPVVIDADGLNNICRYSKNLELICNRNGENIITPHHGEANRLLEALDENGIEDLGRNRAAELLADVTGAAVLLKGPGTLVTMKGQGTYINTTGNPGMATGGSGDVLTGVIAALTASGMNIIDSVKSGAFIHGMAGDIAAEKLGQWGMTSMDIEAALPVAFKRIAGK